MATVLPCAWSAVTVSSFCSGYYLGDDLVGGGDIWRSVFVFKSSNLTIGGGRVRECVVALDTSTVNLTGGEVGGSLATGQKGTPPHRGGTILMTAMRRKARRRAVIDPLARSVGRPLQSDGSLRASDRNRSVNGRWRSRSFEGRLFHQATGNLRPVGVTGAMESGRSRTTPSGPLLEVRNSTRPANPRVSLELSPYPSCFCKRGNDKMLKNSSLTAHQ
jgi:hypothetical protein